MRADNYFVQVPDWITNSGISDGAYRLYAVLGTYASRDRLTCHPARSTLAERTGKNIRSVTRYLRELEDLGAIRVTHRRSEENPKEWISNEYMLITTPPASVSRPGDTDFPTLGDSGVPLVVTQVSHKQEPLNNNQENKNVQPPSGGSRNPDPPGFDDWWKHYPRKEAKGDARKAFKAALRKTDLATLVAATKRYATEVRGTERKFQKLPGGWLRDERWLDYGAQPADVTDEQVVELLGPDNWQPDTSGMSFETVDEEMMYRRRVLAERHEARRDEARRMLAAAGS